MLLISHRGNITGPIKEKENSPNYILSAIENNFDVEVDVWYLTFDGFYLGHDYPQVPIGVDFLKNNHLWCHAKNFEAISKMLENNIRCFWHQKDDYTLTSNGIIWTYPNKKTSHNSIIVCEDRDQTIRFSKSNLYGICSDYVGMI